MLITQEVELRIDGKTVEWYNTHGYLCNAGDIIIVKTKDLTNKSHADIEYECDMCNTIHKIQYSTFTKYHEINSETFCVKCANKIRYDILSSKYLAKDGYKLCKKCNRVLPANTDYYFQRNDTKDYFVNSCKECNGHEFTDKLTNIPKDGYKFCIKCNKELEINSKFYPKDHNCKDGHRNVCRECDGDFYREEETFRAEPWSKEDLNLLKAIYKDYTNEELIKNFFQDRTKHALDSQADMGGFAWKTNETKIRANEQRAIKTSQKLKGRKFSVEHCRKISEVKKEYFKTHKGIRLGVPVSEKTRQIMSKNVKARGYWKGNKNPRHINPLAGELNGNWQGGITNLYQELRSDTKDWQQASMEFCNYKCIITDTYLDNIHHLIPFRDIVNEVFVITELDTRKNVSEYSDNEVETLRNALKELHNKYGYGVSLCKPIHKLFHDNYGYTNNIPSQFIEFIEKLESGNFDNWLQENKFELHINYKVIDYIKSSLLSQQTA